MTTAKRQRQRQARVARLEAERKAAKKAALRRRIITGGIIAVLVIALATLVAAVGGDNDGGDEQAADTTTTTAAAPDQCVPPAPAGDDAPNGKPDVNVPDTPPSELRSRDITVGTGATAEAGKSVQVNYVGVACSTGVEFDTSWGKDPFTFTLGQGEVIPGWDQGVEGMQVGGRRRLVIPPELGYGETGQGENIGPNETLIFVIDLLAVNDPAAG